MDRVRAIIVQIRVMPIEMDAHTNNKNECPQY